MGEIVNNNINEGLGVKDVVWDLSDLYSGLDDAAIQEDMEKCEKLADLIAESYSGRVRDLDAEALLKAVEQIEELSVILGRLASYAYLNFATNVDNPKAGGFLQQIKEFSSLIGSKVVFFDIEWAQVPDDRAGELLADPVLSHYRHRLKSLRRYRPHLLSEPEERLLVEISPVCGSSWVNLFEKVMTFKRFGKKLRTQEEVLTDLYSPSRDVRAKAADELTVGLKNDIYVTTHIFNTLLADKMLEDRLRRYPTWISSMNLANELDDQTVEALISAVVGRYPTVARYYKLKKDILGLDELFDYDRYAPVPHLPDKRLEWSACREMVLKAFSRFSGRMSDIAERFFDNRWIHAPVIKGKSSGAFAHPTVPGVHPYVLVNYTGNFRDVETVAHELGHGVHQSLAADLGYFNSQTPLVLAETASVFGEMLVFSDLVRMLEDPGERLGLLCSKVESIFATVFRQVAMNRFEEEIHSARRTKGELSPDDFSGLWLKTQRAMFMDSVTLREDYGVWWSYIGHFVHTPGYVYAYAFGELLVLSLYAMYQKGEDGFVSRYLDLLRAGGSATPYEMLAPFGIDLRDPGFWDQGLGFIDGMVEDVERLYGELK